MPVLKYELMEKPSIEYCIKLITQYLHSPSNLKNQAAHRLFSINHGILRDEELLRIIMSRLSK